MAAPKAIYQATSYLSRGSRKNVQCILIGWPTYNALEILLLFLYNIEKTYIYIVHVPNS